jgi:ABC-type amino acid transport substrate-binding protein
MGATPGRCFAVLSVAASLLAVGRAARADLAEIQKRGELRVLVVDGAPVFVALKPGGEPGLEREILDGFASLHHLKLRLIEISSWNELVPALLKDRGDLIAGGVGVFPSRQAVIDFSSEVFPTRDVVVTRKPTPVIASLEELRRLKVGTIKGTGLAEDVAAAGVPKANVDDAVPATGFLQALQSGRVAALVDDVEDALLLQKADPDVQLGMFLGPPQSIAFGVRKDTPRLRDALSEYVSSTRKTATWSRLVVKYFGPTAGELLRKARGE